MGSLFASTVTVLVYGMPECTGKKKNNLTWFSFGPVITMIFVVFVGAIVTRDMNFTFICLGMCKSIFSVVAYFPQFYRIYQVKSTKGWSMKSVMMDTTGSTVGMLQVIVDYFNYDNGLPFFEKLNYGKFCLNLFCFFCSGVFYYQHFVLYNPKRTYRLKKFADLKTLSENSSNSISTDLTDVMINTKALNE